jgi:hypothetical protein
LTIRTESLISPRSRRCSSTVAKPKQRDRFVVADLSVISRESAQSVAHPLCRNALFELEEVPPSDGQVPSVHELL